ncbi:MAG: hypothetical protein QXG65_04810 [Thermoplasmata archaeon]
MEIEGCLLPDDRLYSAQEFVWVRPDGPDGTVLLGVVAPMTAFLGPVAAVHYRVGTGPIGVGRSLGWIETSRATWAIRAPVPLCVQAVNAELPDHPRWLNDDPYDRGWFVRARAPDGTGAPLVPTVAAREAFRSWIEEHRVRCWPQTPDARLHEIGVECSAVLSRLNDEIHAQPVGAAVLLVTDDPTSPIEMERWSDQTGYPILARHREGPLHLFLVRKIADPVPRRPPG